MEKNIGIVKAFISNKLKEDYSMNNSLNESKTASFDFLSTVKNSNILKLEMNIFNNLEKKHISNDTLATRYIDENISLLNKYTKKEIIEENKKLEKFHVDENFKPKNAELYDAINTVILENASDGLIPDVDKIHESFVTILNHIKEDKSDIVKESRALDFDYKYVEPETVIEIALKKFNEKYKSLDERERKILKVLAFGEREDKVNIFETLKKDNLQLLESMDTNGVKDKINETMEKIEKMTSDDEVIAKNTIDLYELKKNLS